MTYTTASGALLISGIPYANELDPNEPFTNAISHNGFILPAIVTYVIAVLTPAVSGMKIQSFRGAGFGSDVDSVTIITGTNVYLAGQLMYKVG